MALCGCGGNRTARTADSQSDSGDSILSESTVASEIVAPLPDTVFESAAAVKYKVEIPDTTVSGTISSFDDLYASAPGAFTFRNGMMRQADFGGKVSGTPSEIVVDWEFKTAVDNRETKFGTWGGGSGWTGQPLYVNWPDSCVERFRKAGTVNADFGNHEIIVGSLACQVYFINFETGKASRLPIPTKNPIKGTVSLDPTLNGNLYVGQGVPAEQPFGAMVIDLYKHEQTHFFGQDPKAQRAWGAYDSSPVRVGQFLIRPGENGTVYKYLVAPGQLKLHSALRYTVGGAAPGIEASMSVYRNYGFTADNHGNILAINLDTMRPVWRYMLGDDTDATPVLSVEDDTPYLYVGCEIDRQAAGMARFVKLNALDGSVVWKAETPGRRIEVGSKHFDGGFYATALLGSGNCKDLVFVNCVTNLDGQNGEFVAFNRKDGSIAYRTRLKHYSWSSPVGFVNENDELFVVTGDTYGNIYLINGIDGKIIFTRGVGNNFESSPVVVSNSLVVGSRGNTIFKMTLK